MKLSQKNISIIFTVSLLSAVTLALSVGQNIEIMEFLNARARANFIEPAANNRVGVLTRGTRAEIQQVKLFKSGNSGLYIKVTDGPLSGQSVWVYYNRTSPSLRLATAGGEPTRVPAVSGTGVTTRPIAATPDPVLSPVPRPGIASGTTQVIPVPPRPSPPPVPAPSVSATIGLIGSANSGVGAMNPGGQAGCRDCGSVGTTSGTGVVTPPAPIVAPPIPSPVVAPVLDTEAGRDAGLAYFSVVDTEITAPRGANAALIRAHKYNVLRQKLGNFAIHCDNIKYNRDLTDRTMDVDQARRASDPAAYYARYDVYLNSVLRPINAEAERAFGGANQMERNSDITRYMNRAASLIESPANLFMPGRSARQYCASAERKFNAILNMSAQDFRSYVDMPDAQRQTYLRARSQ